MRIAFAAAIGPLLVAVPLAVMPSGAAAAPSKSFRVTSHKELDEGEAKSVLLSSLGEALPGYGTTRIEVSESSVYCSALAPDGTIYLGTGDQGQIYRYRGGKAEKHSKLDTLLVSTLVVGADGTLYAGGVANGKVFAIDGKGASREVATLEADHVWSLAIDDKTKTLYAATGAGGKLFAIDLGTGKSKLVYDFADKHLLSMTRAEDGSLYVGSSDQAIVWRIWPGTTPLRLETVQDFEGDEVKAIYRSAADKAVYVAVNEFTKSGGSSLPVPPATKGGTKISVGGTTTAAATPSMVARDRKGKGAVYRIDDDGRIEQLLATSDGYFTTLASGFGGGVYAASGANGKVYLLKSDRSVQTAIDVPERQALTLIFGKGNDEALLGTGDAAALYRVTQSPKDPTYTTKVFDAQFAARWGQLRVTGRGGIKLETRSGNAHKPDKTWSAWTALGAPQKQAHGFAGKIASPNARYVQARAIFTGKDGAVSELQLFYAAQNQRARVTEVGVSEEAKKPLGVKPGRPHATVTKLKWKVENPDDDELVYRLQFREENETNWKTLGGPDPLTKTEYEWNTESIADGHYVVQVTASDERANGEDDALTSVLVSDPILVDNKKPELVNVAIKYPQVSGGAKDSFSALTEISYSLDGGDWQPVGAKDGVFDDTSEDFSFKLKAGLNKGTHTVAVRAVDSADNIGVQQLQFQIP